MEARKQRALEIIETRDKIPGTDGHAFAFEISLDADELHSNRVGAPTRLRERHDGDVDERDLEAALEKPNRISSRASSEIERAAPTREKILEREESICGSFLGCQRRPPGIPALTIGVRHPRARRQRNAMSRPRATRGMTT